MTLPNRLTVARLLLSVGLFVLLSLAGHGVLDARGTVGAIAFGLFVVTALTDWLDGYLARRLDAITDWGRILDPCADKILIVGSFVLVAAWWPDKLAPWFVVVVLAREFFVSALRGRAEGRGIAFKASGAGKLKMVTQSVLLGAVLLELACVGAEPPPKPWPLLRQGLFVATLAATLWSGWLYADQARTQLEPMDGAGR